MSKEHEEFVADLVGHVAEMVCQYEYYGQVFLAFNVDMEMPAGRRLVITVQEDTVNE